MDKSPLGGLEIIFVPVLLVWFIGWVIIEGTKWLINWIATGLIPMLIAAIVWLAQLAGIMVLLVLLLAPFVLLGVWALREVNIHLTPKVVEQRVQRATHRAEAEMRETARAVTANYAKTANQVVSDLETYDRELAVQASKQGGPRKNEFGRSAPN